MADSKKEKIGSGHAKAMLRQGLSEIRGAMYQDSNVAQPAEFGIYGKKTAQEVVAEKRPQEADREDQPRRTLEDREKQMDAGRDVHGVEREQRQGLERE